MMAIEFNLKKGWNWPDCYRFQRGVLEFNFDHKTGLFAANYMAQWPVLFAENGYWIRHKNDNLGFNLIDKRIDTKLKIYYIIMNEKCQGGSTLREDASLHLYIFVATKFNRYRNVDVDFNYFSYIVYNRVYSVYFWMTFVQRQCKIRRISFFYLF